jgi:hypothetical protein
MKRFITANIIMVLCTAFSVRKQIDSVTYYMQQMMPNRKVVRFAPLNKASMIHAKYMIAEKKLATHKTKIPTIIQCEKEQHQRVITAILVIASSFWGGEPCLGSSIKEPICFSKEAQIIGKS